MFIILTNDNKGILDELIHIGVDRAVAEQRFIEACAERFTNWDDYTPTDVSALLDDGYAEWGGGVVMFIDTSNCTTDAELRDALTGQPAVDMTVAHIVCEGEIALTKGMTVDHILDLCGQNLDHCNSWDIQGQVLFRGSDGRWYTITTASTIGIANPEWAKSVRADCEDLEDLEPAEEGA